MAHEGNGWEMSLSNVGAAKNKDAKPPNVRSTTLQYFGGRIEKHNSFVDATLRRDGGIGESSGAGGNCGGTCGPLLQQ